MKITCGGVEINSTSCNAEDVRKGLKLFIERTVDEINNCSIENIPFLFKNCYRAHVNDEVIIDKYVDRVLAQRIRIANIIIESDLENDGIVLKERWIYDYGIHEVLEIYCS